MTRLQKRRWQVTKVTIWTWMGREIFHRPVKLNIGVWEVRARMLFVPWGEGCTTVRRLKVYGIKTVTS